MGNFTAPHGMKTYDRHPDDVDVDLVNEAFYERLERMIRAGNGGAAPDWLSADLAMVLYRNVREDEGWRKPATVTTIEELDDLPVKSVVREIAGGRVWEKYGVILEADDERHLWATTSDNDTFIQLPVTVLFTPEVAA